jgi:hypothetical protein
MTQRIFSEPEGGRRAWVFVLIGCYFFVEAVFFREEFLDRLTFLAFGLAVLGFGLADLLPRNRTRYAGLLRLGAVVLMVVALSIRAIQLAAWAV